MFSVTTLCGKDPGRAVMSIKDMGSGCPSSGAGMEARYFSISLSSSSTCSPRPKYAPHWHFKQKILYREPGRG